MASDARGPRSDPLGLTREGLWPYALEIYARAGVEAALLELQDAHGQCAPYLLWALWLAASGRDADPQTWSAGARLARSWQDVAVSPLRDLRRRLKQRLAPVQAPARRRLRERVATLELEAERMLLKMLEDASPSPSQLVAADPGRRLQEAIAAWGGSPPPRLVAHLAALAA